jgi:hypothetical protein
MHRIVAARLLAVVSLGLTMTGVARAGELEGRSGPIAWRASDVQQTTATVDGKRHARHEFALTVKNTGAGPLRLSAYEAAVSYFGVQVSEMAGPLQVAVPAGREYRLSLYTLIACPDESRACRFSEGPTWRIVLSGRAETDTAFTAPLEVILPTDANVPIVRRERVRVTRVSSGSDPARVPATFKRSVILVPASVNGHDVTLLFDTGSQVCLLSPEVARRLGIAVPADAPSLPLIGVGSPAGGVLVQLPPVRVGEYVVEHLTGAVTSLEGFPFAIDGVLGANFIEAFRVTLDHRGKELRLEAR